MKVVLVCIAKWEDTISEWIDYHKKLGFDVVYVYQNDWDCGIDSENVIVIDFPGKHMQMSAYNHFLDNFRDEFDWVSFLDVDEYIVLKKHKNIKDFITEFNNPYGIGINWVYFGSCNQEKIVGNKYSFLSRFFMRGDVNPHIKSIVNLKSGSKMVLPHNPSGPLMDTNKKFFSGPFNNMGDILIAQINHYYHKSLEEWEKLHERGQSDNTEPKSREGWFKLPPHCDIEDKFAYNFYYNNL